MKQSENRNLRPVVTYALVTLFCFVFGLVYEHFGFGVMSPFMHLAFLVPLVLGVLPRLILLVIRKEGVFPDSGLASWRLGIATWTTGSLFRGALDIYGTTSGLTIAYFIAGALLFAAGVVLFLVRAFRLLPVVND